VGCVAGKEDIDFYTLMSRVDLMVQKIAGWQGIDAGKGRRPKAEG